MALSPEMKVAWQQILKTALSGTSEETLRLRCGTCGGPLHIVFTGGERTSLTIRCPACSVAIALDAEREAPPWVQPLGPDVTTGGTSS